MSGKNVEIARRALQAFNEGGLEASQEFWADEVEFHEPPEQPAPRVARGREETAKMFGEFEAAWAEHRSEPEEIRAIDADRVLVLSIEHFRGRDGMEVSARCAQVFTISNDKIVRYQAFWNRETALAAAGVPE
jgi:ketosteroid isomerase-like protein